MLPHTQLPAPKLSFGAAAIGGIYDTSDENEAALTVRAAVDAGQTLIDTSPYYGSGRSESVLGQVLPSIPREDFVISTKCGRYGLDKFDFSPSRLERSIDESLSRLRLDHVDIIFLHDVEFVELAPIIDEALPALDRIRQAGKTRFIGFSGLPLKIFNTIILEARDYVDLIISYCHLNLFDNTLLGLLPLLDRHHVDLINASPTSMGLLTSQGPPEWHPASAEIRAACASAARHCTNRGAELADLAVAFACNHPDISTTLVSAENRQRLERNIAQVEAPIDQELLAEVQSILSPIKNQTWPSGLAENN